MMHHGAPPQAGVRGRKDLLNDFRLSTFSDGRLSSVSRALARTRVVGTYPGWVVMSLRANFEVQGSQGGGVLVSELELERQGRCESEDGAGRFGGVDALR